MAYTLIYSGGNIVVADGNIDSTTSIVLPGRNFSGYGRYINQDLIDMLQNFSRITTSTGPNKAVKGQLWFNPNDSKLYVNASSTAGTPDWKAIAFSGVPITELTTGGTNIPGTIIGQWTLQSGSTIQATYADLAERFEADQYYDTGTVVELGGEKEVTAVKDDCSDNVFGVVSTQAAYLMNAAAGTNDTHPAIAIAGRVPVKVWGAIKKGDRLVSAGNGMARSAKKGEASSFTTIGRALENKNSNNEGTVIATVTAKL